MQLEDGSPQAIVGSDIVLTCELYGVGYVRKIWKKDGKRISDDGKRIVWDYSESSSKKLHKKFKLLIYNVSVDDGGTYTCLARSTKFSTRVSKEFSLEIGESVVYRILIQLVGRRLESALGIKCYMWSLKYIETNVHM